MSSSLFLQPGAVDLHHIQSQPQPKSHPLHDQSADNWYTGGLPTPPGTKEMLGVSANNNNNYGSYATSQLHTNGYTKSQVTEPRRSHSRATSEVDLRHSMHTDQVSTDKNKANAIATYLQIPESVNKSKGSLAEFAAEITCLFWFEDAATLQYAEELPIDEQPDRGLVPDATPAFGFRKWVTTILSTTQVDKNVILLALMFIYRLKKFNPAVSGKRGSEFRLLTIALMLGNKFLDDNTYTNKTWAEVSGISVQEIHIMEVEFLSNMRYELYASEADWIQWKTLLGKFGAFYEKASRFQQIEDIKASAPVTPTSQTFGYKLPSPQSGHKHTADMNYHVLPHPVATLSQLPRSPVRTSAANGYAFDRKRSLDTGDAPPPAKRPQYAPISVPPTSSLPTPTLFQAPDSQLTSVHPPTAEMFHGPRVPQLPMPRLPPSSMAGMGSQLAPLSLPSTRSMASMYHPEPLWPQSTAVGPAMPLNLNSQYPNAMVHPVDRNGPRSQVSSAHTSPVNFYGPSTPTRAGLSPSYFLTNRSSPYRPVRHVNTLLIPPPSAAMYNPVRNIGYEQMHYQPLGQPTERRSGPVPYLQPPGGWQSSNVSTPTAQQVRPF